MTLTTWMRARVSEGGGRGGSEAAADSSGSGADEDERRAKRSRATKLRRWLCFSNSIEEDDDEGKKMRASAEMESAYDELDDKEAQELLQRMRQAAAARSRGRRR